MTQPTSEPTRGPAAGPEDHQEAFMTERSEMREALRHKLLADLFELPVWERGRDRVVMPPWRTLTVEERDLIASALHAYRGGGA